MNIEATEQELQALAGLLDAAVRGSGLRAAKDASVWIDKIEDALTPQHKDGEDGSNADGN